MSRAPSSVAELQAEVRAWRQVLRQKKAEIRKAVESLPYLEERVKASKSALRKARNAAGADGVEL